MGVKLDWARAGNQPLLLPSIQVAWVSWKLLGFLGLNREEGGSLPCCLTPKWGPQRTKEIKVSGLLRDTGTLGKKASALKKG